MGGSCKMMRHACLQCAALLLATMPSAVASSCPALVGPSLQGSPSAALVPHLSVPRMRGARNSPYSVGNDLQARETGGQKGPLGDLITWLDDADVGDVLERYPLPDVMGQPSRGHGA